MRKKISYQEVISFDNLMIGYTRARETLSEGSSNHAEGPFKVTEKRLLKLHEELKRHKYQPTPVKKVSIQLGGEGIQYLGVSSKIDNIVQGALASALEPIYETAFPGTSHVQKGIGSHHALKNIKNEWKSTTWVMNINVKKCFSKANHEILIKQLSLLCDQATIELLRKLISAGYADIHNLLSRSDYVKRTSPVNLISPLLCNIYFKALDDFVIRNLLPKFNLGIGCSNSQVYSVNCVPALAKSTMFGYPECQKMLVGSRSESSTFFLKKKSTKAYLGYKLRRLHYVRYADDFLLGFFGPRKEAEFVASEVVAKLSKLKLTSDFKTSTVWHSSHRDIFYLGVFLTFKKKRKQTSYRYELPYSFVNLRVPVSFLFDKLAAKGYLKKKKDGTVKSVACVRYTSLADMEIITHFSKLIRRLVDYYSCVNRLSDLWRVLIFLRKSCVKTLALKYKLSSSTLVFAKFGQALSVRGKLGDAKVSLFYPKSLKTKVDFKIRTRSNLDLDNFLA